MKKGRYGREEEGTHIRDWLIRDGTHGSYLAFLVISSLVSESSITVKERCESQFYLIYHSVTL